ncbi:MAG: hypothetical protein JW994_02175 [Candidatus Omnitrophica bacterium]|nr:hypothetical protein [Candidatus Omnitrophota bacterium]
MKNIISIILISSVFLSGCATIGSTVGQKPIELLDSSVVYSFDTATIGKLSSMRHIDVYLTFKNRGSRDVSGLVYHIRFKNDFDDLVYEKTVTDSVFIKAKGKSDPDHALIFYDSNDPEDNAFNKLYSTAVMGGTKVDVAIKKIIYADGDSAGME